MKKIHVILLLISIATAEVALNFYPFEGPKPIAVLIQTDPWLMVIGSDTPLVVIYDNGQIIYLKRQKDKRPFYDHKQLTEKELEIVKHKISSFGDYSAIKRYYNIAPNLTDQPETKIYLNIDGKILITAVYGLMVSETNLQAYTIFPGEEKADVLPKLLKDLHKYLTNIDYQNAKQWEPKYVEIMIWEYEYAPEESIHWLKDWPGLDSPNTIKRGDSYSIFLPGSELAKLRDFLKTQKEKGAVEIGGKKWSLSFRFTFPSEPVWFTAFR